MSGLHHGRLADRRRGQDKAHYARLETRWAAILVTRGAARETRRIAW
ncbi:hypothetical protein TSAR_015147 [Trichomalopsis sarcophagae]|uniref:Uncharacterized protein n=1 Tax=Trichomalopsis sarcophagae TaxID=543379 RepID=A0A232EY73_9HYME|nr:hypothetical protein TSAR_015147 [Trichomalopsis sarcophagae]